MIKIFLPSNDNIWFEGEQSESNYVLTRLSVDTGIIKGGFVLDAGLSIPDVIVGEKITDKVIRTWDEAVKQTEGKAQRAAAEAIEKLHQDLRSLAIKCDGNYDDVLVANFLGITGIATAETTFKVEVNPEGLLPKRIGNESVAPVFRAVAKADFQGGFTSPFVAGSVDAVVWIEVELMQEGELQALPRIDVPALPHLSIDFPRIELQSWNLDRLIFSNLEAFRLFRLPLYEGLKSSIGWLSEPPTLVFNVKNGELSIGTSAPTTAEIKINDIPVISAKSLSLTVSDKNIIVAGNITAIPHAALPTFDADLSRQLPGPFAVKLFNVSPQVNVTYTDGQLGLVVTLDIGRILILARTDPNLVLALSGTIRLDYSNNQLTPTLADLKLIEPYPIDLALAAAHVIEDGSRRLLSFIQKIPIPSANVPASPDMPSLEGCLSVLRRIGALAASAVNWLAEQGIAGAHIPAGLTGAALNIIADAVTTIAEAIAERTQIIATHVAIEVRVDMTHWRIVLLIVTPAGVDPNTPKTFNGNFLGFELVVPYAFTPALVCDFEQDWTALVLLARGQQKIMLSTDLWLGHENGPTEPVSGSKSNGAEVESLIQLSVTPPNPPVAIALLVLKNGKASFFRLLNTTSLADSIKTPGQEVVIEAGSLLLGAHINNVNPFDSLPFGNDSFEVNINEDRILSIFRTVAPNANSSANNIPDNFSQSIQIDNGPKTVRVNYPTINVVIPVKIKVSETTVDTTINLFIDIDTLSMELESSRLDISMKNRSPFPLLGLDGEFVALDENISNDALISALFLDFSDGDPRLGLNDTVARIDLSYDKLSKGDCGLGFGVDQFLVSREGINLKAKVKDDPVTLAGVDVPFRFDQGQLAITRSRIQSFALIGHGNLPPALVGEAKASIELNFSENKDGHLILQSAQAALDKSADPLRCEGTRFSITLSKLGLKFVEQSGYHFYFTLTGAAEFRPNAGEFGDGLLKNLSALKIVLNEAPLASDPSVLLKHIEFQVPVEPPKRSSFFDLFSFELRGVGFHPASSAFGGSPALSISGQMNFTDFGDIVTPKFDFHKLWIAPPETGQLLPRVRFDGLGVGLALGSTAEVSGTAIAVDDKLPTLFPPNVLPANVTANGFLASGTLRIQGWASMAASMGFLELENKENSTEKRQAFFLYIQQNDLSEEIPTPIGTFFLREVGFGFGYRYTLAGIAAAEQVESPRELVQILDEVSKYQGNLDDVKAWRPTFDNSDLTLALRGLFSITSASTSSAYNEEKEKELPNLVLFDIVAALRTDLTFLMNVRAFVAYNYADWRRDKGKSWQSNPTMSGYMYLSAPRHEFLARSVYNPGAEIGDHPKLPEQIKTAMKAVRWSSTLYIRPGLFHQEFGWPYELGFFIGNPNDRFYLSVEGGMVLRFEDSAILYGLAFRANGFIRFEYDTGGDFGAAITARADFALGAKLIAYISEHISETMFYGTIALDISVVFSVRMWLKSKWFSLSAGFSQSITIHVGVELLIQQTTIAARIEASVVVSAFGRSLMLGVGFVLGDTAQLEMARARVERFLSLGLGATYPNPDAAIPVSRPAPLPEPSRANNAAKSDSRIEHAADRREKTSPVAPSLSADQLGIGFGSVHYWALLFPIPSTNDLYLVQLVPRDDERFLNEQDDKTSRSHFYAAPMKSNDHPEYIIWGIKQDEILLHQDINYPVEDQGAIKTSSKWDAKFGFDGVGQNATTKPSLKQVFESACFMEEGNARSKIDAQKYIFDFTDTESVHWDDAHKENLSNDPEAANIRLAEAARSKAECGPRVKRMQQIEEARSCFIATVAECAEKLASLVTFDGTGPKVNDAAGSLEFDPRALGLTFVMSESRLKDLFQGMDNSASEPERSETFKVKTRIPISSESDTYAPEARVMLFNPPMRMFHRSPPILRDVKTELKANGVMLYWDLEPAWGASKSVYGDPEYHLKHYRIERRISGLKSGTVNISPRNFTIKRADHLEVFVEKEKNGEHTLVHRRIGSHLQLVDDLQDLRDELRIELLPQAISKENGALNQPQFVTENTKIIYTVVPVDVAGTLGTTVPVVVGIRQQIKPQKGVYKAIARFTYNKMPTLQSEWMPQKDFLRMTIEEDAPTDPCADKNMALKLPPATNYVLRIRTERTIAIGQFGADALSQARSEPPIPERTAEKPGAIEFDITLWKPGASADNFEKITITRLVRRLKLPKESVNFPNQQGDMKTEPPAVYSITKQDWQTLTQALDINSSASVSASRLYIRPEPSKERPEWHPEWCPVQLQMSIDLNVNDPQIGKLFSPAVDITVERFEHPINVSFQALTSKNIFLESGRLHRYHPGRWARFCDFASNCQLFGLGIRDTAYLINKLSNDEMLSTEPVSKFIWSRFDDLTKRSLNDQKERSILVQALNKIIQGDSIYDKTRFTGIGLRPEVQTLIEQPKLTSEQLIQLNRWLLEDTYPGELSTVVRLLRDGERRTGIKLAWNARPSDIGVVPTVASAKAKDLHSLIAGYDLFSLDATAVPRSADPLRFVTHLGRVQRLPVAEIGQDPSETGDFARVEVLYPSETARLQDAKFGKRRAVWYSPAESFLIWPKRVLRRSVLTLPDETDIAALFAKWRPIQIRVDWAEANQDYKWPTQFINPTFSYLNDQGLKEPQANGGFAPKNIDADFGDTSLFSVEMVRRLLLGLILEGIKPDIDENADTNSIVFANLAITLTPKYLGTVNYQAIEGTPLTIKLSLTPSIHPILADVLDLIRYDWDAKPIYRRYEPVIEAVPPVNASDLIGFLDETAPDRDPAGWGVLRTLGLATAFRLYDVETGCFVNPSITLTLLNKALSRVLPRYQDVSQASGAPFVNVMFTTDGLAELASFHGSAPMFKNATTTLSQDKALALVQLELRPTVQNFSLDPNINNQRVVVRYATIKCKVDQEIKLTAKNQGNTSPVLIELKPLVLTDGSSAKQVLLMQGAKTDKFPAKDGEKLSGAIKFPLPKLDTELAYVRFVTLADDNFNDLVDLKQFFHIEPDEAISITAAPKEAIEAENTPWGHFVDLPDTWLAALLFGDGLDQTALNADAMAKKIKESPQGNTLATLMQALARRDDNQQKKFDVIPEESKKRLELAGRLGPWTRRFMEQGLAAPLPMNDVGLAFAMLTRPNPWRLAPDHDGRLSILLMEKDRYGKVRKYAVRPYGRYENLAQAVLTAQSNQNLSSGTGLLLPTLEGAFNENPLFDHFADAVIERTEPLTPPMILATRKRDIIDQHGVQRPGDQIQIIISRHPEEIMSDANIRVDAGLAFRHVAVAFWREFTAPEWARQIDREIQLMEKFGPFDSGQDYARLPTPEGLTIVNTKGLLNLGDIRDTSELIDQLQKDACPSSKPVSDLIWRKFDPATQASLTDSASTQRENDLVRVLNEKILLSGPIYDAKTFEGVALRQETQALVNRRIISKKLLLRINRLLLEDAYPEHIWSNDEVQIDNIRELYGHHPDLWRGAYVLTLSGLPYGFRIHASAHVAAGVTVSSPSVASLDEAGYQLVLPWKDGHTNTTTTLWQDKSVRKPTWVLVINPDAEPDAIEVTLPLVRLIDGVMDDARQDWFGDQVAPNLYRLPDPAVSYRLAVESEDGRVRVGEVELGAITKPASANSLYLAQIIGARFKQPTIGVPSRVGGGDHPTHYELTVTLPINNGDVPPLPALKMSSDFWLAKLMEKSENPPEPLDLHVSADDMQYWGRIAPECSLGLTLIPPDVPDPLAGQPASQAWTDFETGIKNFIDGMRFYANLNSSNTEKVKAAAEAIINAVYPFAISSVAGWVAAGGPTDTTAPLLPTATRKTLDVQWVLGFPADGYASIKLAMPRYGWMWSESLPEGTADFAVRKRIVALLDHPAVAVPDSDRNARLKNLQKMVDDALRRYVIDQQAYAIAIRRFTDEQPVHGRLPLRADISEMNVSIVNLSVIDPGSPFDLLATIYLQPKQNLTEGDVETAFNALKDVVNFADTLEGLAALWKNTTQHYDIPMRWSCHTAVEVALRLLVSDELPAAKPKTLILRRPALFTDKTIPPVDAHEQLKKKVDQLTEQMLFGKGQRLVIQAFHGLSEPQSDIIERGGN